MVSIQGTLAQGGNKLAINVGWTALSCSFLGLFLSPQVHAGRVMQKYLKSSRQEMVAALKARHISDPDVLKAMTQVPRESFVPRRIANPTLAGHAYEDDGIPIEFNRTIPPPYTVAVMTQAALGSRRQKVLEIGTSSGYQTAVLAKIYKHVYTMEIVKPLSKHAEKVFKKLKLNNIQVRNKDGYLGWKEKGPFDAIVVNAALIEPSSALMRQLRMGGKMVVPLGGSDQMLTQITKTRHGKKRKELIRVRFSPMTRATPKLPAAPPPEK